MTKTVGDFLLQDIIAHPEDDAPRLIYADWLTDNPHPKVPKYHEERADFIRLHIALFHDPGNADLEAECRRRFRWGNSHGDHGLPGKACDGWQHCHPGRFTMAISDRQHDEEPRWSFEYQRGFIDSVKAEPCAWLKYGHHVYRCQPVTMVHLNGLHSEWRGTDGWFGWRRSSISAKRFTPITPHELPAELFDLLPHPSLEDPDWKWYQAGKSIDSSLALSYACLALARRRLHEEASC